MISRFSIIGSVILEWKSFAMLFLINLPCAFVGIFSTIKLSLFIALVIVNLLILVAGVAAEYISEKKFNKDYRDYKTENTVVARKIEVAPREPKKEVKEEKEVAKKQTQTKKNNTKKTTTKKNTSTGNKSTSKKTTNTQNSTKKSTKKSTTKKA